MDLINPFLLYAALALGGVGVWLALPRRGVNPQPIGAVLASLGGLAVLIGLTVANPEQHPSVYFYIFGLIALGSALRVITHARPVYAALYFILTILASAGLYLMLSAEFMAFALVIVYAGAILITYLFVIMLATQAPSEEQEEAQPDYDRFSREPIAGTVAGFALLAVLTTLMFRGVSEVVPAGPEGGSVDSVLADLPDKVERALEDAGLLEDDETLARAVDEDARFLIDPVARVATVEDAGSNRREVAFPEDLHASNVENIGFSLLNDHPGSIEIAGVILLMAMLGAVVLSRKQVDMEEEAKARQARTLAEGGSR